MAAPAAIRGSCAVGDQLGAPLACVGGRGRPGVVEVTPLLDDCRAEGPDPVELHGVRAGIGEDDGRDPVRPRRVGEALPEVAGGGGHGGPMRPDPPLPCQALDDQPGPAALEGADRVDGLDLEDDVDARRGRSGPRGGTGACPETQGGSGGARTGSRRARARGRDGRGTARMGSGCRGQRNARRNRRPPNDLVTTAASAVVRPMLPPVQPPFVQGPFGQDLMYVGPPCPRKGLIHEFRERPADFQVSSTDRSTNPGASLAVSASEGGGVSGHTKMPRGTSSPQRSLPTLCKQLVFVPAAPSASIGYRLGRCKPPTGSLVVR